MALALTTANRFEYASCSSCFRSEVLLPTFVVRLVPWCSSVALDKVFLDVLDFIDLLHVNRTFLPLALVMDAALKQVVSSLSLSKSCTRAGEAGLLAFGAVLNKWGS